MKLILTNINRIKYNVKFSHQGSPKVNINSDGTVTGDANGTWKFTNGNNVEMQLGDVTYKGMFLKQKDEDSVRKERMTFTMLGKNVTVWGVESSEKEESQEEEE